MDTPIDREKLLSLQVMPSRTYRPADRVAEWLANPTRPTRHERVELPDGRSAVVRTPDLNPGRPGEHDVDVAGPAE